MAANQTELAVAPTPAVAVFETPPDFYNLIAHERGMPDGWRWYSLEAKPSFWSGTQQPARDQAFAIVRGAVCTATIQRGPRKGQTKWSKRDKSTDAEIVIRLDELDARIARWELETNRCSLCGGCGAETGSIDFRSGGEIKKRLCNRCKGSGKPGAHE